MKIESIKNIALEAGKAIMEIYKRDFTVEYKDDKSPLTEADTVSNKIICDALEKEYPEIPILSEENKEVPYEERKEWTTYWCIDPIDGTKEFIKKNDEFTVNIALIENGAPILGVVYAPATREMYWAVKSLGAFKGVVSDNWEVISEDKLPLKMNKNPEENLTVVASKSHLSDETKSFIDNLALSTKNLTLTSKGSSLKLCMVAEGIADIYPRLAPTMEWDTAAAHAVCLEAGKNAYQFVGGKAKLQMAYNKENLLNPWFVVR